MGTVTVKINLDKTGYSAGITDTRKGAKQLADSLKAAGAEGSSAIAGAQKSAEQLGKSLQTAGAHGVTSMQSASGTLRLLQGGFEGNIRAAERFIGLIPGMSAVLGAAFPIVGAIAFVGALVKSGDEVRKFITTARDMPRVITAAFESLTLSTHAANDELNVSNDKIENQIAKLEHKPENNLKLALDEAKVSADQFAKSVETAANATRELIEKNSISKLQSFFGDAAPTKALAGTIKPFEDDKEHFSTQAAIGKSLGDNSRYDQNMKAFHDKEDAELEKMRKVLADAQAKQAAIAGGGRFGVTKVNQDQTPIMTMAQGVIDQIQLSRAHEVSTGTKEKDDAQLARDQKAAQMTADAKKAAELQKQAQEAMVAQWRKDLDAMQALYGRDLAMEVQFWDQRAMLTKRGGLATVQAIDEANKAIAEMRTQATRGQKEFDRTAAESYLPHDLGQGDTSDMQKSGQGAAEYIRNLNEGIQLQHANASAIAEASIRMEEMTGRIGRLGAAQALAALHTKEYKDATDALAEAMEHAQSLPAGFERDQRIAGLQNQGTQMAGQRSIQIMQDQQGVSGNTVDGAARDSLNKMVQSFNDMAANLKNIIPQMVNGLNDDLAKLIEGHGKAADFGKTLSQAGDSLIKASLQKMEGGFLSAAGLGKPDGSQTNPIWTRDATGVASIGGTKFPFIQPFLGGQQNQQGANGQKGGGSIWGNLLHTFLPGLGKGSQGGQNAGGGDDDDDNDSGSPFQGFFARGGDVLANRPSIIGERGPEMFIPHTAGRIVPNHELGSGGNTYHSYMIDARGATDPAAVHAAVARALPHAVAASMQAHHQSAMRKPQGR